jgi:hypothetical protein
MKPTIRFISIAAAVCVPALVIAQTVVPTFQQGTPLTANSLATLGRAVQELQNGSAPQRLQQYPILAGANAEVTVCSINGSGMLSVTVGGTGTRQTRVTLTVDGENVQRGFVGSDVQVLVNRGRAVGVEVLNEGTTDSNVTTIWTPLGAAPAPSCS